MLIQRGALNQGSCLHVWHFFQRNVTLFCLNLHMESEKEHYVKIGQCWLRYRHYLSDLELWSLILLRVMTVLKKNWFLWAVKLEAKFKIACNCIWTCMACRCMTIIDHLPQGPFLFGIAHICHSLPQLICNTCMHFYKYKITYYLIQLGSYTSTHNRS